ncbi:MAG: universal stress protein [Alphaproteobacteria bacterium]|jgi:nucleotide-binding universal stress UspA family protein
MSKTQERPTAKTADRADNYRSLLVHAEPGTTSTRRVEVAARLARDLNARLIGLGAEAFEPGLTVDPFFGYAAAEWVTLIQDQISSDLTKAEAAFRRDAAGADIEWRSVEDNPARALALASRACDLIVMSPKGPGGPSRTADPADVVMTSGRPVLMVPEGAAHLHGKSVVIAWKDTREARRAVADAMPFLKAAAEVIVQGVCEDVDAEIVTRQTEDVAVALRRHGIKASASVSTAAKDGVTVELQRVAAAAGADLIVAGAYGHSRTAEWAFGGVTRELIHRPPCFVLLSH